MHDFTTHLAPLNRPRLLVQAARFGLAQYRRNRDLKRLLRIGTPPAPHRALSILIEEEARLEDRRQSGDASYNASHHVELLIALMGEFRALAHSQPAT